ncbi:MULTISPECIES: DedA family protein [Thermoactinomyces]|jgi:membrane protein DedA with SNARE-associated domain|uniref:DedA family protein n=1 Tax=Thermoactinomyces vulgaris TaxID=2026 RepID=A0ABS0QFB3_THEVU|nr:MULTISPECIES: DedA family protein [Thermoactinomyces]KFZ40980.1 alkaline phosphatase [Thermoactinomyces sp. Gus2-1]KYQ87332.1 alkaline phosphatase [Thermoactinomyces sp. AS95]MBA4551523.1 DedA family protein [Thermoactinomyces vulgaris]MBA4595267.1 DedA family protein [Thermoactinomyces vulgaris]MBH8584072.1 DedA family protein [Thermoactinomyces sp. CICC 10735]
MENWIIEFMEKFGYFGVFLMIALENIFPPIPSEVVLTFGGFMTTKSELSVFGVVVAATLGAVVGAVILYLIGFLLNVNQLEKIIDRWGHILKIKKEDIHKADRWFERYGVWTVFFCRMVPIVRSLISVPAGMARMNMVIFLVFTTIGTLIWNTILVMLGAAFGEAWTTVLDYMSVYSNVFYVIFAVLFILVIAWYVKKRKAY